MRIILAAAAILAASIGCAPTAQSARDVAVRVNVDQANVAYHPKQAGIERRYQTEDGRVRMIQTHEGRSLEGSDTFYVQRTAGAGRDVRTYHRHNTQGVFKVKEVTPSYTARYNPPLQELPSRLRVGQTWNGDSRVTFSFPDGTSRQVDVSYRYDVLETRTVTINGRAYDAYVVQLQGFDAEGAPVDTHQRWYVPHLGDIKTQDAYFLTEHNLTRGRP
jgi:hypothetical protein